MPEIIVRSKGSTEQGTNVILHEDVQPEHLASDHHAAQLIERVGWAVNQAKDAEDIGSQATPGGTVRSTRPAYRLF
ncbi:MAG: hypothetical protein ACXWE8_12595 [Solirubrobacterales bacterium]